MRFVTSYIEAPTCPYCNVHLDVEASWECDGEPYPDADLKCPNCNKEIRVSQHVVTTLSKIHGEE